MLRPLRPPLWKSKGCIPVNLPGSPAQDRQCGPGPSSLALHGPLAHQFIMIGFKLELSEYNEQFRVCNLQVGSVGTWQGSGNSGSVHTLDGPGTDTVQDQSYTQYYIYIYNWGQGSRTSHESCHAQQGSIFCHGDILGWDQRLIGNPIVIIYQLLYPTVLLYIYIYIYI
jgi:hypothetical protein